MCLEVTSGGLGLGFRSVLIHHYYFILHSLSLDLHHEAELFVKGFPADCYCFLEALLNEEPPGTSLLSVSPFVFHLLSHFLAEAVCLLADT
jgi:hypothetical protein